MHALVALNVTYRIPASVIYITRAIPTLYVILRHGRKYHSADVIGGERQLRFEVPKFSKELP